MKRHRLPSWRATREAWRFQGNKRTQITDNKTEKGQEDKGLGWAECMHPIGIAFVVGCIYIGDTEVVVIWGGFSKEKYSVSSWLTTWLQSLSSNHRVILLESNDYPVLGTRF